MHSVFLDYGTVSFEGDLDASRLEAVLPDIELRDNSRQEDLPELLREARFVLLNKLRITPEVLAAAPGLRLIALSATGTNNVDLEAARARGVAVCNVRDYCTSSVVQHVMGMLLSLTQQLREYDALARGGAWQRAGKFSLHGHPIRELTGRKMGIVGYGSLGRGVAAAARAFGMDVLVANRPGGPPAPDRVDLDTLLPQVDVLSLHCPLTPATEGLMGRERLALMKNDAVLINTARGALIDGAALAEALRQGRLGGAAIDVLPQEPPVDGHPLLDPGIPNLIVTPHIAWAAREARQRCLDEMAGNVADFLRGGRRGRVV